MNATQERDLAKAVLGSPSAATLRAYAEVFESPRRDQLSKELLPVSEPCKAAAEALRFKANAIAVAEDY